jgi:hypothetical protein
MNINRRKFLGLVATTPLVTALVPSAEAKSITPIVEGTAQQIDDTIMRCHLSYQFQVTKEWMDKVIYKLKLNYDWEFGTSTQRKQEWTLDPKEIVANNLISVIPQSLDTENITINHVQSFHPVYDWDGTRYEVQSAPDHYSITVDGYLDCNIEQLQQIDQAMERVQRHSSKEFLLTNLTCKYMV